MEIRPKRMEDAGNERLVPQSWRRRHQQLPVHDLVAVAVVGQGADHIRRVIGRGSHAHMIVSSTCKRQAWTTSDDEPHGHVAITTSAQAGAEKRTSSRLGQRTPTRIRLLSSSGGELSLPRAVCVYHKQLGLAVHDPGENELSVVRPPAWVIVPSRGDPNETRAIDVPDPNTVHRPVRQARAG